MLLLDLFDLLVPRHCVVCGRRLAGGERGMCAACNMHLPRTHFSGEPYENIMAQRFFGLLPVERCAAWYRYVSHSEYSRIVKAVKYYHQPLHGRTFGKMMAEEMMKDGFFEGIDCIIPMPLARNRQRQRGYNQSREFALGVSLITGIPVEDKAVERSKFIASQTHLTRQDRMDNVEGQFSLLHPERIAGRHVLLLDDVCTTGATLISLGKEVLKAGNVKISILAVGIAGK